MKIVFFLSLVISKGIADNAKFIDGYVTQHFIYDLKIPLVRND